MKVNFKSTMKRVLPAVLAVTMLGSLVGCGGDEAAKTKVDGPAVMPETLSIYGTLTASQVKAGAKDRGDVRIYQIAEEKTGCKVEWISPADSEGTEKFNLMIASGEYPDIIQAHWAGITGGAKSYVDDGVILPISDYLDYMPNFKKFVDENPEVAKQFTEPDGTICYLPGLRIDKELPVFVGPQIRQDWLDKLNLKMPTNTDELYEVLKAFKTQDPNGNGQQDEIPFTGLSADAWSYGVGCISWAFDTYNNFYLKDGKVTHGLMEEKEMKEALTYLNKLYSEGLIDPDFLINTNEQLDAKIMNDKAGFLYGLQPTRLQASMDDGTRKIVGVPYFDGKCLNQEYKKFVTGGDAAITTDCENPVGAAMWLDWFFSEEGIVAANFGVEGETFTMEGDKHVVDKDFLFNDPNGLTTGEVAHMNFLCLSTNFPSLQTWEGYSQTLRSWGKDAIETWASSADITNALPNIAFTAEEKDAMADQLTTISTYASEQFANIIIGRKSVDELGNIAKELNKMGMQDVLKIYNDAYQRFID